MHMSNIVIGDIVEMKNEFLAGAHYVEGGFNLPFISSLDLLIIDRKDVCE